MSSPLFLSRELELPDGFLSCFTAMSFPDRFVVFSFGLDMCYIIVYTLFKQGGMSSEVL